ncbi:DUF6268 family outer membrane beta-barrel protein [Bacteroidota bacterium]
MKKLFLLLLCIISFEILSAQDRLDILTISGKNAFPGNYDSLLTGKAKESGSFVGLTVPVPVTEKTIIVNNLNYFYFHVNNEPVLPNGIVDPISLHGFIFRTGILQKFDDGKSLQLLLAPRIMTDMKGGGMDNFQFGGVVMYDKIYSESLTLGFGAIFNQEFFGPYLVPIINLKWSLSDKINISGLLPLYAKVKYHVSSKFNTGISFFGLTTSFGLNDQAYENDYIERLSIDLALYANYNIAKNINMEARFGQSMSRCYKQYDGNDKVDFAIPLVTFGDNRTVKNIQFEDGLFFELRVIYSIAIPE